MSINDHIFDSVYIFYDGLEVLFLAFFVFIIIYLYSCVYEGLPSPLYKKIIL